MQTLKGAESITYNPVCRLISMRNRKYGTTAMAAIPMKQE